MRNLLAARACIGVDCGIGPDISQVKALGEDRLHGAWTSIISIPRDLDAGPQPRIEPPLRLPFEIARNQGLDVRDVWEMTDADRQLLRLDLRHCHGKKLMAAITLENRGGPLVHRQLQHQTVSAVV